MDGSNGAQDVTNHQINHLTLIQSFVSFQQTKILRIISTGDIDIYGSYAWFDSYQIPDEITALSREGGIWKFFRAFVNLLRHSSRETHIPDTLQLDSERIADLRTKLLNAVNMNICMNTFKQIDKRFNSPKTSAGETFPRVKPGPDTIERNRRFGHVYSALRAIVHDYSNPDFDTSSPPTSLLLNFDPWKVATPALALEMLRNTNAPLSDPYCEKDLTAALSNPSSEYFRWSERPVFERLGVLVEKHVDAWQSLDSVALYKVAPVCPNGCKIHGEPKETEPLDGIARRIAHLGVLHWNVWGRILYLVNPNEHPNHSSERH